MPRPGLLTPASSTDIKAKGEITSLHLAFELPPPAIQDTTARASSHNAAGLARPSKEKDSFFALPPPPSRSRKIIQMKPADNTPKTPQEKAKATAGSGSGSGGAKGKKGGASTTATTAAANAAGRKIARKTAHSLIERRRRNKMNEEFSVLRNMIPACTDDMHKLAILQASIEYIRYLEDCVSQLKAHSKPSDATLPSIQEFHPTQPDMDLSPVLEHQRHPSHSSASFVMSASPSPAFGPKQSQTELDKEATTALLMLNNDRRGSARGLSVRDLLSG